MKRTRASKDVIPRAEENDNLEEEERQTLESAGIDYEVFKDWPEEERNSTLRALHESYIASSRLSSSNDPIHLEEKNVEKASYFHRMVENDEAVDDVETQAPVDINISESNTAEDDEDSRKKIQTSQKNREQEMWCVEDSAEEEQLSEDETQAYQMNYVSPLNAKVSSDGESSEVSLLESFQTGQQNKDEDKFPSTEMTGMTRKYSHPVKEYRTHSNGYICPPLYSPRCLTADPDVYIPVIKLMFSIYFQRLCRGQNRIKEYEKWKEPVSAGRHEAESLKLIEKSMTYNSKLMHGMTDKDEHRTLRNRKTVKADTKLQEKSAIQKMGGSYEEEFKISDDTEIESKNEKPSEIRQCSTMHFTGKRKLFAKERENKVLIHKQSSTSDNDSDEFDIDEKDMDCLPSTHKVSRGLIKNDEVEGSSGGVIVLKGRTTKENKSKQKRENFPKTASRLKRSKDTLDADKRQGFDCGFQNSRSEDASKSTKPTQMYTHNKREFMFFESSPEIEDNNNAINKKSTCDNIQSELSTSKKSFDKANIVHTECVSQNSVYWGNSSDNDISFPSLNENNSNLLKKSKTCGEIPKIVLDKKGSNTVESNISNKKSFQENETTCTTSQESLSLLDSNGDMYSTQIGRRKRKDRMNPTQNTSYNSDMLYVRRTKTSQSNVVFSSVSVDTDQVKRGKTMSAISKDCFDDDEKELFQMSLRTRNLQQRLKNDTEKKKNVKVDIDVESDKDYVPDENILTEIREDASEQLSEIDEKMYHGDSESKKLYQKSEAKSSVRLDGWISKLDSAQKCLKKSGQSKKRKSENLETEQVRKVKTRKMPLIDKDDLEGDNVGTNENSSEYKTGLSSEKEYTGSALTHTPKNKNDTKAEDSTKESENGINTEKEALSPRKREEEVVTKSVNSLRATSVEKRQSTSTETVLIEEIDTQDEPDEFVNIDTGSCPICDKMFKNTDLEMHAATCGDEQPEETLHRAKNERCFFCNKMFPVASLKDHQFRCAQQSAEKEIIDPVRQTRSGRVTTHWR